MLFSMNANWYIVLILMCVVNSTHTDHQHDQQANLVGFYIYM